MQWINEYCLWNNSTFLLYFYKLCYNLWPVVIKLMEFVTCSVIKKTNTYTKKMNFVTGISRAQHIVSHFVQKCILMNLKSGALKFFIGFSEVEFLTWINIFQHCTLNPVNL